MNACRSQISPVQARCKPQALHRAKPLRRPFEGAVAICREESRAFASNVRTVTQPLPKGSNATERNRTQGDAKERSVTHCDAGR